VGATLWSDVDPAIWEKAVGKKGDCNKIYIDAPERKRLLHPSDICQLHAFHKLCLKVAQTPLRPSEKVVVVTHHMPTKQLLEDRFKGEEWHTFYASNSEDLFSPAIPLWICGHRHRSTLLKIHGGPLLAMNARGYNKDSELDRTADKYNPATTQKVI
jgi:hypothetical protein